MACCSLMTALLAMFLSNLIGLWQRMGIWLDAHDANSIGAM
ncbi:hypothetical protein [Vreelandella titanicae]